MSDPSAGSKKKSSASPRTRASASTPAAKSVRKSAAKRSTTSRGAGRLRKAPDRTGSRLVEAASAIAASRRRDLAALAQVGLRSYAGVEAVLRRRVELLRDTLSELRTVGMVMRSAGPRESAAHLDALARGALQLTLNNVRQLVLLAASKQREALDVLASRLQADLEEFKKLRSR